MRIEKAAFVIAALAACLGAAGVAASAVAAHGGYDDNLKTAAQFALTHSVLVAALCLASGHRVPVALASAVILLGAILFCGDLALRAVAGHSLFPMAAPTGGSMLIGGWLLLGVAALLALREKPR